MQEAALTGQTTGFFNNGQSDTPPDDFFVGDFDGVNDSVFVSTTAASSTLNKTNLLGRQQGNQQKKDSNARRGAVEDSMDFFCGGPSTDSGSVPWSNFGDAKQGAIHQGDESDEKAASSYVWKSESGGVGGASWVNWEPADFGDMSPEQKQSPNRSVGPTRQNSFNGINAPPKSPASHAVNRQSRRASLSNVNKKMMQEPSLTPPSSSSQNRRGSNGSSRRSRSRRDLTSSSSDHNPPSRRRSRSASRRERLRNSGSSGSGKRGDDNDINDDENDTPGQKPRRSSTVYAQDAAMLEWRTSKNRKATIIGTSQRRLGSNQRNSESASDQLRHGSNRRSSTTMRSPTDNTGSQDQDWTEDLVAFDSMPSTEDDGDFDDHVESSKSLRRRAQSSRNLGCRHSDEDNSHWTDRRRRAQSSRNLRIPQDDSNDQNKRRRGSQLVEDANVRNRLRARSEERRRGLSKSPSAHSRRRLVSRESSSGGGSEFSSDNEESGKAHMKSTAATDAIDAVAVTSHSSSTRSSSSGTRSRAPSKSPKSGLRRRIRRNDSSGENGEDSAIESPSSMKSPSLRQRKRHGSESKDGSRRQDALGEIGCDGGIGMLSPIRSPSLRQRKRRGGGESGDEARGNQARAGPGTPVSPRAGRRRHQSVSSRNESSLVETPSSGYARRSVSLNGKDMDKAKYDDAPVTPTAMIARASETLAKSTSRRNLTSTPTSRRRSTREGFKSHFSGENVAMSPGSIRRSRRRGEHEAPSERRRSRSSSRAAARRRQKSRRNISSQNDDENIGNNKNGTQQDLGDESPHQDSQGSGDGIAALDAAEALQFSVANNFAKSANQNGESDSQKQVPTSAVLSAKKKMRAAFNTVRLGIVLSASTDLLQMRCDSNNCKYCIAWTFDTL